MSKKFKIGNAVFADAEDFADFTHMRKIMGLESEEMFRRIWEAWKHGSLNKKTMMPGDGPRGRGIYLPQ